MRYGYARVSTLGQEREGTSLESQKKALKEAGAEVIYADAYTGTSLDRPEFNKLKDQLQSGDMLIVTKLDRFARSCGQALVLIDELIGKGVTVNVLNMGVLDNSPTGKLMRTMFLAFAEFERDMIVERTQEGRKAARKRPGYVEGRPRKYSKEKLDLAMSLLEDHSYTQVEKMTGISVSTLTREKRRRKAEALKKTE